jgi:hypothetical protein
MQGYVPRKIQEQIEVRLADFPVGAVLGPRQCGKTTLVQETVGDRPGVVYLDLERPSDLGKLRDPELFFTLHRSQGTASLFCLDEIQRVPEIFPLLRSLVDEERRNGQFLLLGSASRDLLRQTSESLAGRITYLELTPFLASELLTDDPGVLPRLWFRGGFPRSFLAPSEESSRAWRDSFTRTFLEGDIPQLGFNVPAATLHRLWRRGSRWLHCGRCSTAWLLASRRATDFDLRRVRDSPARGCRARYMGSARWRREAGAGRRLLPADCVARAAGTGPYPAGSCPYPRIARRARRGRAVFGG